MCSRYHKEIEKEINQTKVNKLQVQTNINAYINRPTTQQINFNSYKTHNEKNQSNKKKKPTRQIKLNIAPSNQLLQHDKTINIKD